MLIHRSIESSATKRAPSHWRRTSSCSAGAMLARNRTSRRPRGVGQLGREVLEDVQVGLERLARVEVVAVDARPEERLAARDVLDVVGDHAAAVQHRVLASPKSSPTGPTTRTSSKNDAASAKCTAAPPSMRSRDAERGPTASKAIDPTTVTGMRADPTCPAARRRADRSRDALSGGVTAFADLGLSASTLQALQDVGYEKPSPIQEQAIPSDARGRGHHRPGPDRLRQDRRVRAADRRVRRSLASPRSRRSSSRPTRELCIQVTQALRTYGAAQGRRRRRRLRRRADPHASRPS